MKNLSKIRKNIIVFTMIILTPICLFSQSANDDLFNKNETITNNNKPKGFTHKTENKSSFSDEFEYGSGIFFIQNPTGLGFENAMITMTLLNGPENYPLTYMFVTDSNGYAQYDVITYIELGVGTGELLNQKPISVFPNPSSDFNINCITRSSISPLSIYNVKGEKINEIQPRAATNNNSGFYVDLHNQENGIYFAKCKIDGQLYTEKLIKVNNSKVGEQHSQKNIKLGSTQIQEALYQVVVEVEWQTPHQTTINISTGENPLITITID